MTKLNRGCPEEFCKTGFYFKSKNNIAVNYGIVITEMVLESNCTVVVYEIPIPVAEDNPAESIEVENGEEILLDFGNFGNEVVSINLWGKYFFPTFKNDFQWYYDHQKYYPDNLDAEGKNHPENPIQSLADVMEFAIEFGLKKAKIEPY